MKDLKLKIVPMRLSILGCTILSILLASGCLSNEHTNCHNETMLFKTVVEDEVVFNLSQNDMERQKDSILMVFRQQHPKYKDLNLAYISLHLPKLSAKTEQYKSSITFDITNELHINAKNLMLIMINDENKVLCDMNLVEPKQLDSIFHLFYLNPNHSNDYSDEPLKTFISIKWSANSSQLFVEEIIDQLTQSYVKLAKVKSEELFQTELCHISETTQLIELRKKFPLRLALMEATDSFPLPAFPMEN